MVTRDAPGYAGHLKIIWVHGQVLDLVGTFDFMTKDYCKLPYKAFNVKKSEPSELLTYSRQITWHLFGVLKQ